MPLFEPLNQMRVGEKYEIGEDEKDGKCLRETGRRERATRYDPWEFPEIVSEFAGIQFRNESSLLSFVHARGPLGDYFDEPVSFPAGDPVIFIEAHAAIVRFALKLIDLIHKADAVAVDEYLHLEWPSVETRVSSQMLTEQSTNLVTALGMTGLRAGSEFLSILINPRITGRVGPFYQPTDAGPPRHVIRAFCLLDVIYCHLADAWEGKTGFYQCARQGCETWWPRDREARGPRAKYCPPPAGTGGESLCGRKERYRQSHPVNKS